MKSKALVPLIALAGCATPPSGPLFTELRPAAVDSCVLYMYRLSKFPAGGHAPTLVVDGKSDVGVKNGGYLRRELSCGSHRLELLPMPLSDFKAIQLETTLEKGKTKFLRYTVDHLGSNMIPVGVSPGVVFTHKWRTAVEDV